MSPVPLSRTAISRSWGSYSNVYPGSTSTTRPVASWSTVTATPSISTSVRRWPGPRGDVTSSASPMLNRSPPSAARANGACTTPARPAASVPTSPGAKSWLTSDDTSGPGARPARRTDSTALGPKARLRLATRPTTSRVVVADPALAPVCADVGPARAYAPITAPAAYHRSSTVTTARPSARNVSSAAATSPPPRVSSRPAEPGSDSSV